MKDRSFEIGFGDTYEVRGNPERTDVVVNVGEGSWFDSARVRQDGDTRYLTIPGTSGAEYIERITGQMSLQEVLTAAEEGARRQGYELSDEQRNLLRGYSSQGRRRL